jgi:SulP family sulfate permease
MASFLGPDFRRSRYVLSEPEFFLISSTVRRHPKQSAFLRSVGSQIRILRLQGFVFFGTTSSCERTIRDILDSAWTTVRFLVLDFSLVSGIDFSAAESFLRVQRLCLTKGVLLVLCGCGLETNVGQALRAVDLWTSHEGGVEVFEALNDALEVSSR